MYICTKLNIMEQLSRHIERLLLRHNCVIVPGIGGFVAQYVPARYIEEEHLFIPPFRNVGFNPLLTINDGLLTQSYMTENSITYTQGVNAIRTEVSKLHKILETKGEVEFSGIGTLSLTSDGTYDFNPISGGIASPILYALDVLSTSYCSTNIHLTENTKIEEKLNQKKKSRNEYILHINKTLIHNIAAAVVAILFYFAWTMPLGDIKQSNEKLLFSSINKEDKTLASNVTGEAITQIASTLKKKSNNILNSKDKNIQHQNNNVEKNAKEILDIGNKQLIGDLYKTSNKPTYTIVLVSAVPKCNAEKFVESLNTKYSLHLDVIPMTNRNNSRIIFGSFKTENEARARLRQLRCCELFEQAWVMKL